MRASRTVLGARRGEIPLRDSLVIFREVIKGANRHNYSIYNLVSKCSNADGQHYMTTNASNRSDPRVETRVVREKKAGLVAYKGLRCDSEWILPLVCHA